MSGNDDKNDLDGSKEAARVKAKKMKGSKKSFSIIRFLLSLALAVFLVTTLGTILVIVASNFKLLNFAAIFAYIEGAILVLLVIIILFFMVIIAGAYSIYIYFAPKDLFWGGAREGTSRIVVTGPKGKASFVKAIMSFKGYKFDKDWNIVPDKTFHEGKKSVLEQIGLGGIYWIGIPHIRSIYEYFFSWSTLLPNGKLDPHEINNLDHISLKEDTYGTLLPKAETGESMVPIDVTLLITAQIVNPRKALFEVDHWLQNVINIAKVPVLAHIATMDNPRELLGNEELTKLFFNKLEDSEDIEYFINKYGVKVSRVEVGAIDLDKDVEAAAMEEWKAEQKGKATVMEETKRGEAYGAFMGRKKKADKDYYDMINDLGDLGTTMRYLETAEKASNIVIPFGMIGDIAKQVLTGNKSPSEIDKLLKGTGVTMEDLKELIAVAKTMKEKDEGE